MSVVIMLTWVHGRAVRLVCGILNSILRSSWSYDSDVETATLQETPQPHYVAI